MQRPGPRAHVRLRHLVAIVGLATVAIAGCSANNTTETSSSTTAVASSSGSTPGTSKRTTTTAEEPDGTSTTTKRTPGTSATGKGSDPDSEFCQRMKTADELQKSNDDSNEGSMPSKAEVEEFLATVRDARDAAPDEAIDPLDTIIDAYEQFETALDSPNPEESAFTILASEENFAAITKLSDIVKDTCGFALTEDSNGSGTGSGTGSGSGTPTSGTPTSGYDCSSLERSVEGAEDDPTSISKVQVAVCEANRDASWMKSVMSGAVWSSSGGLDEQQWYVGVYTGDGTYDLDAAGALAVCESMSDFLTSAGANVVSIKVGTSTKDGAGEPDAVLASRTTGPCSKT